MRGAKRSPIPDKSGNTMSHQEHKNQNLIDITPNIIDTPIKYNLPKRNIKRIGLKI